MLKKLKNVRKMLLRKNISLGNPGFVKIQCTNKKTGVSKKNLSGSNLIFYISNVSRSFFHQNNKQYLKTFFVKQRIKYRIAGKAYRFKFNDSMLMFRFNRSHPTTLYYKDIDLVYFKNKGFNLKFNKSPLEYFNLKKSLMLVRPRNIFNSRGLWEKKSIVFNKRGKVSAYR